MVMLLRWDFCHVTDQGTLVRALISGSHCTNLRNFNDDAAIRKFYAPEAIGLDASICILFYCTPTLRNGRDTDAASLPISLSKG